MKYEEVGLHAYDSVSTARAVPDSYFRFYNERRPHSNLHCGNSPHWVSLSAAQLVVRGIL
ncbi:MAG: integrase core domain-containing protein [Halioglobus sp.]|nr:integrase core domain-containing protein [Halioglobus sp.]